MTKRPINVLHVTRSIAENGGIEEYLRILASNLDRDQFRLGICSIQDIPCKILPCFKALDIPVYCGNRKGTLLNPLATLWIADVIKDFQADIVHTHTDKGNFHGRLAARRAKVPVITTHHDMGDIAFARTLEVKERFKRLEKKVGRRVKSGFMGSVIYPFFNVGFNEINRRVICVSDAVRILQTNNPIDQRFVTIHSPYDETIFQEDYQGLEKEMVTLGVVGRLVPQKGHFLLLEAVKKLKQQGKPVTLKIIGDGPLREALEKNVIEADIEKEVHFCGDLPHNQALYQGVDIYLQPSFMEGCSITLLEAMATGIPIVASNIDGPAELLTDGETGRLVEAGNAAVIVEAILHMMDHREEAKEMGKAAAKRARELFSSEVFLTNITSLYKDIFSQNSL